MQRFRDYFLGCELPVHADVMGHLVQCDASTVPSGGAEERKMREAHATAAISALAWVEYVRAERPALHLPAEEDHFLPGIERMLGPVFLIEAGRLVDEVARGIMQARTEVPEGYVMPASRRLSRMWERRVSRHFGSPAMPAVNWVGTHSERHRLVPSEVDRPTARRAHVRRVALHVEAGRQAVITVDQHEKGAQVIVDGAPLPGAALLHPENGVVEVSCGDDAEVTVLSNVPIGTTIKGGDKVVAHVAGEMSLVEVAVGDDAVVVVRPTVGATLAVTSGEDSTVDVRGAVANGSAITMGSQAKLMLLSACEQMLDIELGEGAKTYLAGALSALRLAIGPKSHVVLAGAPNGWNQISGGALRGSMIEPGGIGYRSVVDVRGTFHSYALDPGDESVVQVRAKFPGDGLRRWRPLRGGEVAKGPALAWDSHQDLPTFVRPLLDDPSPDLMDELPPPRSGTLERRFQRHGLL